MSLCGEDGLDATQRDAPRCNARRCSLCGSVQPNYVRALAAPIGFPQGGEETSLLFSLAAEGSTGAEVGRTGLVLTVQTSKPAFTKGGGESFSPGFGRRMCQQGFVEGRFNCTAKSVTVNDVLVSLSLGDRGIRL